MQDSLSPSENLQTAFFGKVFALEHECLVLSRALLMTMDLHLRQECPFDSVSVTRIRGNLVTGKKLFKTSREILENVTAFNSETWNVGLCKRRGVVLCTNLLIL